jgi:hypothetical protein
MRYLGLVFLIFISNYVGAAEPKWIYNGELEEFQHSRFITALGEGSNSENARKMAYSRLAEQIKVSISSQTSIVQEYRSNSGQLSEFEGVDIEIRTHVNLDDIEGISIVASHHLVDTNTYYTMAVLDKVKTAKRLSQQLDYQFDTIRSRTKIVRDHFSNGRPSQGLNTLLKISHSFEKSLETIELQKLFGSSASRASHSQGMFQLIGEFDLYLGEIFGRVLVETLTGSEKEGSPELGVKDPYQLVFSYNGKALVNVPVALLTENQGATIDLNSVTDKKGQINVQISSLEYSDRKLNPFKVGFDLYDKIFVSAAPSIDLIVLLSQKSEVAIRLITSVKSDSHDYLDQIINEELASLLSVDNYLVSTEEDDSDGPFDYILESKVKVTDLPGIGGLHFSKIGGVIRIKSNKSGRVVKTIRIDSNATKAGAINNADAAEKSAGKLIEAVGKQLLKTLEENLGRS